MGWIRLDTGQWIPIGNQSLDESISSSARKKRREKRRRTENNDLRLYNIPTHNAKQFYARASRFGLPSHDFLLFHDNFIICYSFEMRHASWVLDHIPGRRRQGLWYGDSFKVCPDYSIDFRFRSRYGEFTGTGYDRGHLSPARQHRGNIESLKQCYMLSNIAPMVPNINRRHCSWHRLETYIYGFLPWRSKNIYVVTGTLYDALKPPFRLGLDGVGVPSYFYKVFVHESLEGILIMEAFVLPNRKDIGMNADLERFRIDINTILPLLERGDRLRFFRKLDRRWVLKPNRFVYGFDQWYKKDQCSSLPSPK